MNNYLFVDAVSHLDTDLLTEHLEKKDKLRNKLKSKRKVNILRWSAVAACLCLVIAFSAVLIPHIKNYVYEGQMKYYNVGATVEKKNGTLTFSDVNMENHTCSFTLVKKDNSPLYFKFSGYIVEEEWTDEQGINRKKAQQYDVITPYENYEPDNGRKLYDAKLLITVNGNIVDALPSEAGEYEVMIDYSELYSSLDHVDDVVEVYNFGYFNLINIE